MTDSNKDRIDEIGEHYFFEVLGRVYDLVGISYIKDRFKKEEEIEELKNREEEIHKEIDELLNEWDEKIEKLPLDKKGKSKS